MRHGSPFPFVLSLSKGCLGEACLKRSGGSTGPIYRDSRPQSEITMSGELVLVYRNQPMPRKKPRR